jgi:hypothetical protein
MADSDQAYVGRCPRCEKLHAAIVVTPRTAREISSSVREMEADGLTVEQMTVGEALPQLAFGDCEADSPSSPSKAEAPDAS